MIHPHAGDMNQAPRQGKHWQSMSTKPKNQAPIAMNLPKKGVTRIGTGILLKSFRP